MHWLQGRAVLLRGDRIGKISKIYDDARNGLSVAEVKLDQRIGQPNGSYLTIGVVTAETPVDVLFPCRHCCIVKGG